ncbi:UAA-domain-containing protein [Rickenella mellea]|uniref:UAA-domain-containing protein n=1 Tax=Rickenella mellea TaxID=50990 RepID=A0A4R5XDL3_9AGAM|nr:UAA-domain-containing protein [Rickenella mellea]
MSPSLHRMYQDLFLSSIGEWFATLIFIFGGCCSNALALELITSQYTHTGSLITFAQFLLVTVIGLRKQLVIRPPSVTREEAFGLICVRLSALKESHAETTPLRVALAGPNDAVTAAICDDLSVYLRSKLRDFDVQVEREGSPFKTKGKSPTPQGYPNGHVHSKDPASSGDKAITLCRHQSPSTRLDSHTHNLTIHFNAASYTPDVKQSSTCIILDITDATHPIILHPRNNGFFANLRHIRFKRSSIPLTRYFVQVVLFLLVSLLNNAAFAYQIPMAVHIIFRSGGLVVNMVMGWFIEGRRYTKLQIISVLLVTLGISLTTLSSMQAKPPRSKSQFSSASVSSNPHPYLTYMIGIMILTLALILSGFLGLSQDRTYAQYGRGHWEEAMFYMHALSLPMFAFVGRDINAQVRAVNAGPQVEIGLHTIVQPISSLAARTNLLSSLIATTSNSSSTTQSIPPLPFLPIRSPTLLIPSFYFPLLLNVVTQVVCVSGVNRLTSRVNSLTVALVLVVRKAVSLAISVLLLGGTKGNMMLWTGAAAVLIGTVGYTLGGTRKDTPTKKKD